ncbi:MAG TPA: PA2169 family four-helix-bundle protein [Terriglobales bacterium]
MSDASSTLDVLHELIETCRDGSTGYAHAAAVVKDPELKAYFTEQSQERIRLLKELELEAKRIGESQPDISGSAAGALHRAWFEAKVDIGLGDQAVLNSVEAGEDAAKKAYEKALQAALPDDVRGLVQRQAESVVAAHDRVRDLRDARKAA